MASAAFTRVVICRLIDGPDAAGRADRSAGEGAAACGGAAAGEGGAAAGARRRRPRTDRTADASTPEERLRRLGERVGVGTHSRSRAFFTLSEPLSRLLTLVEQGKFDAPADVVNLYDPNVPPPNNYVATTLTILHHWSAATGRDLKATAVVARPR